ncbi:MAG: ascorbate-dependent monooxygenase [Acidobacteriota bacterium]|nr:ascorbate-dependent monooxygenase [Acidobacteriota bacterium]
MIGRALAVSAGAAFAVWTAIAAAQPPVSRPRPRVIPPRDSGPAKITFTREISRLLQAHCQTCHHDGGIAPFPLVTYSDALFHGSLIAVNTRNRIMPPWHVDSACTEFQDDPSLAPSEIQAFSDWVDSGAPEGDPGDLPPPVAFSDGWALGAPDKVLTMSEPMTPDFSKGDVYRCFVMPTGLSEDRYVEAAEVVPGVGRMVHHVILFIDTTGASESLDAADPGPGYSCFGGPGFTLSSALGGWAPGNVAKRLPEGVGLALPKNSRIVMQVHYSALARVSAPDVTSVGLHFSKKPVQKVLRIAPLINQTFVIPAGASDHVVTASLPYIPVDVHLYSVTPHMHLLGRTMNVRATSVTGQQRCLVDVKDWDFHWQRSYFFQDPLPLPAGSRLDLVAHYDNSASNPQNVSNPPREVRWGENTTDEMCIAFLTFTIDDEIPPSGAAAAPLARNSVPIPPFWEVEWPVVAHPLAAEVPGHWHHGSAAAAEGPQAPRR